ncbi:ATP-dependent DNA helicase PIF1 [Metarhizium album ARSEF 1941]|uniref:ATP-dependent DNA helicase n=1 Tax=Metarhizium album (strain ARSEF 1941) TaxID=1081103 RepID=A0A0B2WVE8_METAS|nr:ATP-dependent DNA helicase PIF1 [Metarhizium album ARSEF 1941]KHN97427.1 ATP-dependent DNA helicase PIF1 [Metarhizium album ARSEF 1941]
MASAGHGEDAGAEAGRGGERCCSLVASDPDTDYSWDWLDSESDGLLVAASSSREARNEAGATLSVDADRANPSADETTGNDGHVQVYPRADQGSSSAQGDQGFHDAEPKLCQEQQDLVDVIASGRNVFFTGSAGCGKSTVLKAAITRLKAMGLVVHVVAPTGRAALQVNGVSTWSYMGWTPDHHKLPMHRLKSAAFRRHVRHRLKSTDVLIIDEISMVENHHLERINICMKEVRRWRDEAPPAFGGAQVVVSGDFCQLPPVKPFQHCIVCGHEMEADVSETWFDCPSNHGPFYQHEKWAFMSEAWEECGFAHVELKQIHRQNDASFISMLQKCRRGIPLSWDEMQTLVHHPCNVTNATRLFSTRAEVTKVNADNFNKLQTPIVTYETLDGFVWHHELHPHLEHYNERFTDGSLVALKDHRLERRVQLRVGMLVVLQVNLDLRARLCNGSQGIICGFEPHDVAKLPRAKSTKVSPHTGPTASSGPPAGRPIIYGDYATLKERQVQRFMDGQEHKVWPRVLFHNGDKRTIHADCIVNSVGNDEPYSLLHRTQIPLVAAWAMTIHKSQGMTLDRVIVNLTRAFEEGQVYVALSRATGLHGLKIEGSPDGLSVGRGGNAELVALCDSFLDDVDHRIRLLDRAEMPGLAMHFGVSDSILVTAHHTCPGNRQDGVSSSSQLGAGIAG